MITVWTNDAKGNDRLIGVGNNRIYKANPKTTEETESLAKAMRSGSFDSTKVWDIDTSHCNEIRLEDGKPFIEIFWGKEGEEQLRVTDEYLRYKIFEHIKAAMVNATVTTEKWNAFRAGKKPLIAFAILSGLFAWTLFYAIEGEAGNVYYIENGRYNSLTGVVLGLASLGLTKVITIFSFLLGLAVFGFTRKVRRLPVMHRILIKK